MGFCHADSRRLYCPRNTHNRHKDTYYYMSALARGVVNSMSKGGYRTAAYQDLYRAIDCKEIDNNIKNDSIFRQIIEVPASDALSEWRETSQQMMEIERAIDYKRSIINAAIDSRKYGKCLLFPVLTYENGNNVPANITLDKALQSRVEVKRIHVFRDYEKGGQIIANISRPEHGKPAFYVIDGVRFNSSRVVELRANSDGHTVYESIKSYLDTFHNMRAAVESGVEKMNFVAVKTDLEEIQEQARNVEHIGEDGDDVIEAMHARANMINEVGRKDGVVVLDLKESIENISKPNVSDIIAALDQSMQLVAGAGDIPLSRLFARVQSGLSNSARVDIENYVQALTGYRFMSIDPVVEWIDKLIAKVYGVDTSYQWKPLKIENYLRRLDGRSVEE